MWFNAGRALKNNKMYSADEVGEMSVGNKVGPSELVAYHKKREERATGMMQKYRYNQSLEEVTPQSAYSPEVKAIIPSASEDFEKMPLEKLAKTSIQKGYLSELIETEKFLQWLRLSLDNNDEI